jgi:hypothetical protein
MDIVEETFPRLLTDLDKVIGKGGGGEFLAHKYLLHVVRMRYITIYINMLQVISGEITVQRSCIIAHDENRPEIHG